MRIPLNPIAHVPPRKPIDLRPVWTKQSEEPNDPYDYIAEHNARAEAERMWAITRQTAEGTNMPMPERDHAS